jgi:MFS family permease
VERDGLVRLLRGRRFRSPEHSATAIGLLGTIPYLVGAVGMLLVARDSDRTGERRFHGIGLMLPGTVGLADINSVAAPAVSSARTGTGARDTAGV